MGMERMEAARRSFWVVVILGVGLGVDRMGMGRRGGRYMEEYSQIAGRNFSWMSQMLFDFPDQFTFFSL